MNDFIWTNHAIQRLYDRKISKNDANLTLYKPDKIIPRGDTTEYTKKFGDQTMNVVIKNKENVIISLWINPPNPGTIDEKKDNRRMEIKKASLLKKFYLTLINQLGF